MQLLPLWTAPKRTDAGGDVRSESPLRSGFICEAENLTPAERLFLLDLARRSLTSVVRRQAPPSVSEHDVTAGLAQPRACFVTLTRNGVLRGCVGNILAQTALYQTVARNTRSAATRDPRFAPVAAEELAEVSIEISVLTEPKRLACVSSGDLLEKLRPSIDGVLLRVGSRLATFLPQVWSQIPGKVRFLNRLAEKAGCEPSAWRGQEAAVFTYHAECFSEQSQARIDD
jgi:AmmeMemoRadiSam system protein A